MCKSRPVRGNAWCTKPLSNAALLASRFLTNTACRPLRKSLQRALHPPFQRSRRERDPPARLRAGLETMARGKVKSALALNDPVAMVDMPLLVRLLWKGKNVFSRSWLRDWFVVFKNRHAFFSVFLCHPQHPFTWKERFFLIVCVLMMGWALATAAEVALTRAEEIALENAKGDDEETARAYERYRDFKDKNGATVTLFGSIIVQSFCARPAAPASSLLPPHAV